MLLINFSGILSGPGSKAGFRAVQLEKSRLTASARSLEGLKTKKDSCIELRKKTYQLVHLGKHLLQVSYDEKKIRV